MSLGGGQGLEDLGVSKNADERKTHQDHSSVQIELHVTLGATAH